MFKTYSVKKILLESIKVILIVFILSNIISYIRKPNMTDRHLPDMKYHTINNQTFDSAQTKGKPLILYFWGSWCPICNVQSPTIAKLSTEYQVITIAVNSGIDKDIQTHMKKKDLQFQTINDYDGKISQYFNITIFPTTLIYNKEGINTFADVGYTSLFSLKLKLWLSKFL